MMPEDRFWKIIAESRRRVDPTKCRDDVNYGDDFQEQQMKILSGILADLPPRQIIDYEQRITELVYRAYRYDLMNAVCWMHGGCGDDRFLDFRHNLVSPGRERYYRVFENPDCLAEIEDERDVPTLLAEGFGREGSDVYQNLTGVEMDRDLIPYHPEKPVGERIDEEDVQAFSRAFPRLYAKYPEMGD